MQQMTTQRPTTDQGAEKKKLEYSVYSISYPLLGLGTIVKDEGVVIERGND